MKPKYLFILAFLAFGTTTTVYAEGNIPSSSITAPTLPGNGGTHYNEMTAPAQTPHNSNATPVIITSAAYVLGAGDHVKLNVYGEEDLSGEYEVSDSGVLALPLIGDIQAGGQSVSQVETLVRGKLSQGYLHDPKVSLQVINYRPFFILGEVSKPGSYPYVSGMTVLNAVALAGGYTYRASVSRIKIVHNSDKTKQERDARENDTVLPGDIIRVPERFF